MDSLTGLANRALLMEHLDRAIAQTPPCTIDGQEVTVTASIGIVLVTQQYDRGPALLRDADAAMYRAKDAGRARFEVFAGTR